MECLGQIALAQGNDRGVMPETHDSNTLHKIGKAIQYSVRKAGENVSKTAHKMGKAVQYPVRKTGENASVTAHQAIGNDSVVSNRHTGKKKIVTASGKSISIKHQKPKM